MITSAAAATVLAASCAQAPESLSPEHAAAVRTLQPRIETAIDRGVAWLLSTQQRDGSWAYERELFRTGQTALCAYTLLKCRVPPDHSAVQRAVANIRTVRPALVYAVACQMLALGATGDAAHHDHLRQLARDLERGQDGGWDYPNDGGAIESLHTEQDLSITQFALLGLRAAHRAGLPVSSRSIRAACDAVLRYQGRGDVAGFRYLERQTKATGSMTTAGIGAAMVAADCLGDDLGRARRRQVDDACARALAWLDAHWTVETNPHGTASWLYYYLYGLERVGSLLGREYVGAHPWYLEGARFLLDEQNEDGSWSARDAEPDTCFALLFLARATAPTTGVAASRAPTVETPADSPVGVVVRGGPDGSRPQAWLTRLAGLGPQDTTDRWPFVTRVSWLVDGTTVDEVALGRQWRGAPCLVTLPFRERGTYRVAARVETVGEDDASTTHESVPIEVVVDHVLEDWMLDAATAHTRNLLAAAAPRASASSTYGQHDAGRAVDGDAPTAWLFERGDVQPLLQVRLAKSVRARRLWFAQAFGQRRMLGTHDRIERIAVTLDRQEPIELELRPDELAPTVLELPASTRFKQLEVRVLARAAGSAHPGLGGFSEIGAE